MSTPDVPPNGSQQPGPEDAERGDQPSGPAERPAPRYGQYAPGYGPAAQQPPAYGQQPPAYGQQAPAYGQLPPAYGQQSGMYGPPTGYAGPAFGAPGPQVQRSAVRRASILLLTTAAAEVVISAFVVTMILNLPTSTLHELFTQVSSAAGTSAITFAEFEQAIRTFLYLALAAAVVNAAMLVLCGVFLPKGKRWARTLGTVFLCLTVGSFFAGSLYALVTIALAVASIALLFRPGVSAFLNAQNQFANPYTTPKGPTFGNPYGQ